MWHLGRGQFAAFAVTILTTLTTDLLIGVAAGVACKWVIYLATGTSVANLFSPLISMERHPVDGHPLLRVEKAAIFSNWLALRKRILGLAGHSKVHVDLSGTHVVDLSVLRKLQELTQDWAVDRRELIVGGLDGHHPVSSHPMSTRIRKVSWEPATAGAVLFSGKPLAGEARGAMREQTRSGLKRPLRLGHHPKPSTKDTCGSSRP